LTSQHAAVANQRQQVISDREHPVVAGGYEAQVHARLYHAAVLDGAARRFEEIAAGREAAAA
jgi:hypothetical protein